MDFAFISASIISAILLSFVIFGHMPGFPSSVYYLLSLMLSSLVVSLVLGPIYLIGLRWVGKDEKKDELSPRSFRDAELQYQQPENIKLNNYWRQNVLFCAGIVFFLMLFVALLGWGYPTIKYIFNF